MSIIKRLEPESAAATIVWVIACTLALIWMNWSMVARFWNANWGDVVYLGTNVWVPGFVEAAATWLREVCPEPGSELSGAMMVGLYVVCVIALIREDR